MRLPILINKRSGGILERGEESVAKTLQAAGGADAEVCFLEPDALSPEIERWIAQGSKKIVVGGGDGTVSTAARFCVEHDICLGVLPLGTCNFFSRDLGIPLAIAAAAEAILSATKTRRVDLAEVNGQLFVNAASLGAYPEAVALRERARENSETYRWSALSLQLLEVLKDPPMVRVRSAALNGGDWAETPFLFIGNNRFSTRLSNLAHRESLSAGGLHVMLTDWTSYGSLASILLNSLAGDATASDALLSQMMPSLEVELQAEEALLTLDGERQRLRPPLQFRSRPGALLIPDLEDN